MQKAGTRRRKAYWVFFKVALSYVWLFLGSKIRGKAYWTTRIKKVNKRSAERIKHVMLDLQGLFIKFGQLISTLSNILPEEFRTPLEALQDDVPAHSFSQMEIAIKKELGKLPKDIFSSIDPIPLAAASIGQVHRATIGDKEVIVKIQHPQIEELVLVDLSIIKKIVGMVARFMKIKGMEHLYQQVEQMIEEELDYVQEAQSMQLIKKNLANEPRIYIPVVYEQYSSKRVLTMEYCQGSKISDLEQLSKWGHDLQGLSELLVRVFCKMILADGFYHADPHPGNLLVNQKGQIVLLDFGAVARLSPEMKDGIPKLISCTIKQDTEEMVKVLRKLGFLAHGDDTAKIAEVLIDSIQDFVYNELKLENMNIQNITPDQMRKAFKLINIKEMTQIMQIPKDWVLLNRAVVLVSGVSFLLSPDWNPIQTIDPYLKKQLLDNRGSFTSLVVNSFKNQLNTVVAIPLELKKALRKINKGKLEIEVKNIKEDLKGIQLVAQQMVWLVFFIASMHFYIHIGNNIIYPNLYLLFQGTAVLSLVCFCWNALRSTK
jgi:ubiquinone biosynthesis protein